MANFRIIDLTISAIVALSSVAFIGWLNWDFFVNSKRREEAQRKQASDAFRSGAIMHLIANGVKPSEAVKSVNELMGE